MLAEGERSLTRNRMMDDDADVGWCGVLQEDLQWSVWAQGCFVYDIIALGRQGDRRGVTNLFP